MNVFGKFFPLDTSRFNFRIERKTAGLFPPAPKEDALDNQDILLNGVNPRG